MNSSYFVIEEMSSEKEVMTNEPDVLEEQEELKFSDDNLAECPSCGKNTLKVEGGCHSCVNEECGFSKCDI